MRPKQPSDDQAHAGPMVDPASDEDFDESLKRVLARAAGKVMGRPIDIYIPA